MKTYQMSRAAFENACTALRANGVAVSGDAGTLQAEHGVKISYRYADGALTLEIIARPFWISEGTVFEKIEKWMSEEFHAN